jgi:hypothetical protein
MTYRDGESIFGLTAVRLALCGVALWAIGCGTGYQAPPADNGTYMGNGTSADANLGGSCSPEGKAVGCGEVVRRSGNYVSCSVGTRQCSGGQWGPCVGDAVTTKTAPSVQAVQAVQTGLHIAALGATQVCVNNPCDPSCNVIADDGSQLDAGPGFVGGDSGITLITSLPPALQRCTGLAVSPATQNVTITSISPIRTDPPTVTYTASLVPAGCYNLPYSVTWDIDKFDRAIMPSTAPTAALGILDPLAGTINISAFVGSLSGITTANVLVNTVETASAPVGTAASFSGAGSSADTNLNILYPYNNTVYPVAIGAPLVQWSAAGASASAVEVSLTYPTTGAPLYHWAAIVAESNPPRFAIPQYAWSALDDIARGNDVQLSVQRLVGGVLHNPKTITMHFSPLGLRGRIFYTQYFSGNGDVRTFQPGSVTASNVSAYPPGAGTGCNNPCHTINTTGTRLITSNWYNPWGVSNINADGTVTAVASSPSSTWGSDSRGFAFSALTRDGNYAVQTANWWGNSGDGWQYWNGDYGDHHLTTPLQIWHLSTTPGTAPVDVSGADAWGLNNAAMLVPTFSPDGTKLLGEDGDRTLGASWRQGLHLWDFNDVSHRFANQRSFVKTVATNEYIRWPNFESDSRSVMFQTNPTSADDNTYGGMLPSGFETIAGKLYSVDSQTANTPVPLDAINVGLGGSDSDLSYQPTMLPVSVGGYRWAVFTSRRLYGNTLNVAGTPTTQLWVSAVDDQVSTTTDRSHPPFWLPGQSLGDNYGNVYHNERGYWSLDACEGPGTGPESACTANEQCCGGLANPPTSICRIDLPVSSNTDDIWVEDALPTGATTGTTNESWVWIPQTPAPAFGTAATKSSVGGGEHQHYFYNASATMPVGATDTLYAYVYLDPTTPPSEVMLQWHDTSGSWEHRAYWGSNGVGFGNSGTTSRHYEGPLPITGQWVRLELPASDAGMGGVTADGLAFTLYDGQASWDHAGHAVAGVDNTWVEDALPTGAVAASDGGDGWNWVSNVPTVPFGVAAHENMNVAGVHQHYFLGASQTLAFNGGESALTYAWLDPNATPTEIMLQWHDTSGSWEHRAYWGADNVGWGSDNTTARHYMGPLPATGQWIRLEIPVELVGLAGVTVDGMAFTLSDGDAAWDHSGKVQQATLSKHCSTIVPPVCIATGAQCLADTDCCGYPNNKCISGLCIAPSTPIYYDSQTFTRDYTATCTSPQHAMWRFFDWQTVTPGDSALIFSAQTAADTTSVATASLVPLATVSGPPITNWTGVDVSQQLASASPPVASGQVLRITVKFQPTSDGGQSPTLVAWRANYDCVDAE